MRCHNNKNLYTTLSKFYGEPLHHIIKIQRVLNQPKMAKGKEKMKIIQLSWHKAWDLGASRLDSGTEAEGLTCYWNRLHEFERKRNRSLVAKICALTGE